MFYLFVFLALGAVVALTISYYYSINHKTKKNSPEYFEKKARKKLNINDYAIDTYFDKDVTPWLNDIINEGLKHGIVVVKELSHSIQIVFKNGVTINGWNNNKYYGWLSSGKVIIQDNKTNNQVEVNFNAQPTAFFMLKLVNAINEYNNTNTITKNEEGLIGTIPNKLNKKIFTINDDKKN